MQRDPPTPAHLAYRSSDESAAGFSFDEAQDAIQFCIELDNQDDRFAAERVLADIDPMPAGQTLDTVKAQLALDTAKIDPGRWDPNPIFDSRQAVAKAYQEFKNSPPAKPGDAPPGERDIRHWAQLFADLEATAQAAKVSPLDAASISKDPRLNGFGGWQNAWMLYRGVGANAGRYAIAIRGTVFSNKASALDDVYFQPVSALQFVSPKFTLADGAAAAVHSGFAHATFSLMLDLRFGILPHLLEHVPPGSRVDIIGHSQGAAIGTLVHAALHFGMRAGDLDDDNALGLKGRNYRLKSYVFAQPKPGDFGFSTSFARITQGLDNAFVINNDIDPVARVPLTLDSTGDLAVDFKGGDKVARFVRWISGLGTGVRLTIGRVLEPPSRKASKGFGNFFNYRLLWPEGRPDAAAFTEFGTSWSFSSAGRVIWLSGHAGAGPRGDDFYQHHATTYACLLQEQAALLPPGRRVPGADGAGQARVSPCVQATPGSAADPSH